MRGLVLANWVSRGVANLFSSCDERMKRPASCLLSKVCACMPFMFVFAIVQRGKHYYWPPCSIFRAKLHPVLRIIFSRSC